MKTAEKTHDCFGTFQKTLTEFYSVSVFTILLRQMEAVFEITKKIIKATYDEKEANIKTLERKIDKLM